MNRERIEQLRTETKANLKVTQTLRKEMRNIFKDTIRECEAKLTFLNTKLRELDESSFKVGDIIRVRDPYGYPVVEGYRYVLVIRINHVERVWLHLEDAYVYNHGVETWGIPLNQFEFICNQDDVIPTKFREGDIITHEDETMGGYLIVESGFPFKAVWIQDVWGNDADKYCPDYTRFSEDDFVLVCNQDDVAPITAQVGDIYWKVDRFGEESYILICEDEGWSYLKNNVFYGDMGTPEDLGYEFLQTQDSVGADKECCK